MKFLILFFISILFVSLPFSLCGQTEEEYLFPDDYSLKINEEINTYQDYDYGLTKKYTYDLLKHSKKCEEDELTLLSYTALEYYSYVFSKREEFEKITEEADHVFDSIITKQNLYYYADYYFEHLNNYSLYLFRKNKIMAADTLISEAINLLENNSFKQSTKSYYLTAFYQNLSSFKELQWNFSEGISLLEKIKNLEDKSYASPGFINQNISSYHQKTGNYSEALDYAKIAVDSYKKDYLRAPTKQNLKFYSISLIKLANLYSLWQNPEKVRKYLNELPSNSLNHPPLIKARFAQTTAQLNLLENKPTLALKNYQKSLKIQKEKLPNRITDRVDVYQSIAKIYHQLNQIDSTFHYLQKAIILLSNNPNLNDIEANPQQFELVTYKQTLLDILHKKSNILLEQYTSSQDICDLQIAMKTSESAQDLSNKIRLDLSYNSDKEFFSKKAHKIYRQAMQIASLSEKFEHSPANFDFAYRAMESSRALLLAEAVYQSNSTEFAGIPTKTIKRENTLQEQIIEQERQIFLFEQEGADAEDAKERKRKLQVDFDKFTDSLRVDYPDYYNLKFAVQRPNIKALQADLASNNQTFVEYLLDDKQIHALIIAGDKKEIKTWPRPEYLKDRIKSIRSAIYDDMDFKERANKYVRNAYRLYQDLVEPLGNISDRIVIIPDGVLNYLPFDVLLTELPEYNGHYHSHNYLLKSKQISYDYSATLRMQKRKSEIGKIDFMGFAPYYGEKDAIASRGVGNLKFNMTEVDSIRKVIGGVAYLGDKAKKQQFKNQCHKAGILHFAGHAVQEEINPDFSHLLFSRNTKNKKSNQMPVKEIYAHHIPTQMVVLSACNTGMGAVQEGEGMYSLGRAFSYAGAHSLISTLWSVNDESTEKIMINFYHNLKKGMPKDKALQEAKKSYIYTHTHKKSRPLNWAGFVAYGDMSDIEFSSSWFRWFNW